MQSREPADRFGPRPYASEVERLCGYIKNDSLIRWKLECSQAEIDAARARLAGKRPNGTYTPKYQHSYGREDGRDDMARRRRLAQRGNARYLAALERAASNG